MTPQRKARAAAIAMLALTAAGAASTAAFAAEGNEPGFGVVLVAYAAVGWLVTRRHPGNSVGWLLLSFGVLGSCIGFMWAYQALAAQWSWPGGDVAEWAESWIWAPTVGVVVGPLLVLFPNGRLPSRRWRFALWTSGLFVVMATVGNAFYPYPPSQGGPNPYAIADAEPLLRAIRDISGVLLMVSIASGVAALVVRYRRAQHVERQQLKWFLLAAILMPVLMVLGELRDQALQDVVVPLGLSLLAVSVGVAILRHGLYDIDRIISRTVGWALITVVIGGVYLGGVTLLTAATAAVAGDSAVAVAASTLLAAAAFGPVRRRIQGAVDRRFNRASYDAATTVAGYRSRLRDQVELDAVADDLLQAVRATVQPERAALWLRAPEVPA